jgi:hypothetical protein
MKKEELAYLLGEFVSNGHWTNFIDWATSEEMGYSEDEIEEAMGDIREAAGRTRE